MVQPEEVKKPNGKAVALRRFEFTVHFIADDYALRGASDAQISETGVLVPFRIEANQPGLPNFKARWDEKATTVDIDALGVSKNGKKAFKDGENGSFGHHTERVDTFDGYKYEINFGYEGKKIFHGTIQFGLTRAMGSEIAGFATVKANLTNIAEEGHKVSHSQR